jgi:hypothetical protein
MDYANACKIVIMRSKLYALRDAAAPSQYPPIDSQLSRLDPCTQAANALVMQYSDQQFAAAGKALQAQIKPITDAIADITQINNALTTAAQIINDIVAAVGVVARLP